MDLAKNSDVIQELDQDVFYKYHLCKDGGVIYLKNKSVIGIMSVNCTLKNVVNLAI